MSDNHAVESQDRISYFCDVLERFLAEATPGPWFYDYYSTVLSAPMVHKSEMDDTVETRVCVVPHERRGGEGTPQGQKDGDLIAAARNTLPELIAEVRRLREEVKRLSPQPIETAPKDGTEIQGWGMGRWSPRVRWSLRSAEWEEWIDGGGYEPDCWAVFLPTHWMPIFDPPKEPK